MSDEFYSVTILGNVEARRTEAEISNPTGNVIALIYEDQNGWQTERIKGSAVERFAEFESSVNEAKRMLSRYVNRKGGILPQDVTVGAVSLWLMIKDDGTALGKPI
jgi:hypothetical protein